MRPPLPLTPLLFLLLPLLLALPCLPYALHIDTSRLLSELHQLATHSALPPPPIQRVLFTPADLSARAYLRTLFLAANLTLRVDPVGNLFAVWRGSSASHAAAVATGSHIDAIPYSGRYDGVLGVLGALEAVRALQRRAFRPVRDVHVLVFTAEEPTRFGLGCLGSRLLTGALRPADVRHLVDADGIPFEEARRAAGFRGNVADVALPPDAYHAFVELHIEQADTLQRAAAQIGAVTAIAAPAQLSVRFHGPGGHAGALAMSKRRDAGVAAAALVLEVERAAVEAASPYAVATVGTVAVFPGAVNSVPREATLGVDVRDVDEARRDAMVARVTAAATRIAQERGVQVEVNVTNRDAPAACSERVVRAVEEAAQGVGKVRRMVSRAYHDALFMARKFETGMVFVPCRGGVSHRPDEFVEERDVRNGVLVLAKTIAALAGELGAESGKEEL